MPTYEGWHGSGLNTSPPSFFSASPLKRKEPSINTSLAVVKRGRGDVVERAYRIPGRLNKVLQLRDAFGEAS